MLNDSEKTKKLTKKDPNIVYWFSPLQKSTALVCWINGPIGYEAVVCYTIHYLFYISYTFLIPLPHSQV